MISSEVCITEYNGLNIAWLERDSKIQLLSVTKPEDDIVYNIYVGVVKHVMANLNACFVEFIEGRLGFLSFNDVPAGVRIVEGALVTVQVVKEASKNKEAVLTMNLSLSGNYCVVDKSNTGLCISSKITGADKEKIRNEIHYDGEYGVIVRTNTKELDDYNLLYDEISVLTEKLKMIESNAATRTKWSVVYDAEPEYIRFIKGLTKGSYDRISTDIPFVYDLIIKNISSDCDVALYKEDYSFAKLHSLETKLEEIMSKQIWLRSGGNIVIEYTEALTVVDVNSAKNVSKKDRETLILKTNIEACKEIARQLRLRNVSGIIVVDFINMKSEESLNELISTLKNELKSDSVRCEFVEFTKLGLAHIVRKKIKPPVYEIMS